MSNLNYLNRTNHSLICVKYNKNDKYINKINYKGHIYVTNLNIIPQCDDIENENNEFDNVIENRPEIILVPVSLKDHEEGLFKEENTQVILLLLFFRYEYV